MKKQILLLLAFVGIAMNVMADNLSIADVSLTRGTAQSVDVSLANTATNIVGFQFDLTLPTGVTPATSSTGAVSYTATDRLGSSYTLRGKLQSGTTYRFVYLSTSGTAITGTSGSLFSISLTADDTAACGSNVATISNVTLTGKDGTETTPADVTYNITLAHNLTATAAKAATCTEAGNKAYWHCSACDKYFSDAAATAETTLADMTIAALGHSYGEPTWSWSGYTAATISKTCTRDADVMSATATITNAVTTAATCTTTGILTYTAKATLDGTAYTDTKTEELAALGHNYGEPVWTWADDGKTASAKITCANDASHVISGDATVTSAVKTAATCDAKGVTTYTAKVTLNGTEYTDTKDVEDIDALGHDLSSKDNGDGTHTTTCSRCDYSVTEAHTYVNDVCSVCGAAKAVVEDDTDISKLDNAIYAAKVSGFAGAQATLKISLKSTFTAKGFQYNIEIPSGASFVSGTGSNYSYTRGERVGSDFTIVFRTKTGESTQTAMVTCYNIQDDQATISDNDGIIMNIPIDISGNMAPGDYNVKISNITLVKSDGEEYSELEDQIIYSTITIEDYLPGDANCSGTINVADITSIVSYMYGNTPTVFNEKAADVNGSGTINVADITSIVSIMYGSSNSSSAKRTSIHSENAAITIEDAYIDTKENGIVNININSKVASAFQMDITLPEGLSIMDTQFINNNNHILHAKYLENGTYRIVCYSLDNTPLSETGISTLKLSLVTDNSIEDGDYRAVASNIILSDQGNEYTLNDIYGFLQIGNATAISNVELTNEDNSEIYDLQGRKLNTIPRKSIYIKNGKKYIK